LKLRRDDANRPRAQRAALVAVLSLAGSGCLGGHGAAYEASMTAASRDEGAGRYDEAVREYDRAVQAGERPRDRDQARWDAASSAERAGKVADAAKRYEAVAGDASSEHQAEGAYQLARLRIGSGDADRGWQDMEQIPRRYPTHGVSHLAVRRLVEHADERGPRAGLDELATLSHDLEGTELAPLVLFLRAEHLEATGDAKAAREAYGHIADRWPYPFGAFFDDALWHASLIDERLGQYPAAIDDLERLLRERETTSIVGSYERAKYVPAMLRVGELYRDRLHDHPRARDAFHRLYTDFAHSTLRDRGLWLEAALWRADGNVDQACDALGTLVEEFPSSRYVPCAVEQCSWLRRPKRSKAPDECRDYIRRAADHEAGRRGDDETSDGSENGSENVTDGRPSED
jgi:tetratricopeptide (TPR) repeat protein